MADWFSSVQLSKEDAEAMRKQVLERLPSDFAYEHDKLWEYDGPDSVRNPTRRSPVFFRNGGVVSSQPLASAVGFELLLKGCNAAETAIGVSAALAVTEPCSCGLGGDMFCLYYEAATKRVTSINGSGRSPSELTLEKIRTDCPNGPDQFKFSAHAVTVPGAARGWEDLLKRHGSGTFTIAELLEPAAKLAEEGFPVAPVTSHHWTGGLAQIKKWLSEEDIQQKKIPLTVDGVHPPGPGDIVCNPDLARVLRELGAKGAEEGFYKGFAGKAIVEAVQKHGGLLSQQDMENCESSFPDPISVTYRNVRLWEVPPNGQGIAALIALKGLEALNEDDEKVNNAPLGSADYYHKMIEMMRLGFADNRAHVTDIDCMKVTPDELLDTERLQSRAKKLFDPKKAVVQGVPDPSSCTVSFQVVDKEGNAISFVNSNFMGFGTGIVPENCGFALQNRGFGMNIDCDDDHPNVYAPSKRPYHTILPGILTWAENDELYATLSNMGGNMQPQGHMQLTVGMVDHGLDPQAAIDFPRFCIAEGTQNGAVYMEKEVLPSVVEELVERGHTIQNGVDGHGRAIFGRAQIIRKDPKTGVWCAGSDGRADGQAIGY